jgi:hypothetical protein
MRYALYSSGGHSLRSPPTLSRLDLLQPLRYQQPWERPSDQASERAQALFRGAELFDKTGLAKATKQGRQNLKLCIYVTQLTGLIRYYAPPGQN